MNPSGQRREVRVSSTFFEMLDVQLRPDCGPNGEPSAADFLVIDLPEIVDAFAVGFDELPEARRRPNFEAIVTVAVGPAS